MDKELLKEVLLSQAKKPEEKVVERAVLSRIKEHSKTPFIIIISGVRRCGKSTVLQEIRNNDCYYVNFDDERLIQFTVADFQVMHELLMELFGERNVFIFDEIQNIKGWERFVRRLYDQKKKIYISGSNASMLSRELGTHLTGRNISLPMFPFSFSEYLEFRELPKKTTNITSAEKSMLKKAYNEYLIEGGFPEYLQTKKEDYLRNLYENVIYRDVITRYKLSSEKPIKETAYYIASNIGKEISFNSIKKLTGLTSATTIKEYMEYLENSYLAFLVPKYNSSLKKQIYSAKKVYFIDQCLARLLGFRESEDRGRMMENAVFLNLKRKNEEIYFHREKNECDFIIRKGGKITSAIQVTVSLKETNREREISGLLEAMKKYKLSKGIIITEDQTEEIKIDNKKISVVPVWKWLLEE
ncbi:MAG: ATP-binding protein [Nanoarchaeota archaeon]|nr:ATP-binding protein [Nanoarchaeota archaeon]